MHNNYGQQGQPTSGCPYRRRYVFDTNVQLLEFIGRNIDG